jgi:2-pyrone-4,6-dicarboxylate lactonase
MTGAPTWHPAPSRPALTLPAGTVDTHCHVFGPQARFPYDPGRTYTPGDAGKERLFALHDHLGIEACVIVQPGVHGFDHAATLDAIRARPGRVLGVALVPVDVPDVRLRELDAAGIQGVRFNFMPHLGGMPNPEAVLALAGRIAGLGWSLTIHTHPDHLEVLAPALRRSPVPVVIDHMARIVAAKGPDQPAFRLLRYLMEDDRFWVKVSGCERSSTLGHPYADAVPLARTLVADHPDRVLWGTDWPHPNFGGPPPDDGLLLDLLADIAPADAARRALLVDNPRRLYRF